MRLLYGALDVQYVLVRVTHGALVAYRNTYAHPRCKTEHYSRNFIPLSVSMWNDRVDHVYFGVVLREGPMLILLSVSMWNDRVDHVYFGVVLVGLDRRANAFLFE